MATIKQKRAFKEITENHLPVSKAMREVGYDNDTASKPSNLTESKGWKELCEQAGLTDDFLLGALREDIEKKPQNRKAELELAFKVKGQLKDKVDPPGTQNNFFIFNEEQSRRIATRITGGNPPNGGKPVEESSN